MLLIYGENKKYYKKKVNVKENKKQSIKKVKKAHNTKEDTLNKSI